MGLVLEKLTWSALNVGNLDILPMSTASDLDPTFWNPDTILAISKVLDMVHGGAHHTTAVVL